MSTFDEVEQAMLLAVTDPHSPHFPRAMSDMRAAALEKELEAKKIDRIALAMLMDKDIEKNLLIEEQMNLAQKAAAKYAEDYAAYQRDIYKQQVEDMHLTSNQLSSYLTNQNAKLEDEIKKLESRLARLPAEQAAIRQEWNEMQKNSIKELAVQLAGLSFTGSSGATRNLQKNDIQELAAAIFIENYNANRVIDSIPGLATADPAAQQEIAAKMTGNQAVMGELRMLRELAKMDASEAAPSVNLKPSELKKMREKNKSIVDTGLNQIQKQSEQANVLHVKAINASEGCVKQQLELAKDRLEENKKTLDKANKNELEADQDHSKKTSHLPTPKPK